MGLQLGDVVGAVGGGGGRVLFNSTKTINVGSGLTNIGEFEITEPCLVGVFMGTNEIDVAIDIKDPSGKIIDRHVIGSTSGTQIGVTGISRLQPGKYILGTAIARQTQVTVSRVWAVEVTNPDD